MYSIINLCPKTYFLLQLVQCPTQSNETNLEIYRESMTRYTPSAAGLFQILLHICILFLFVPKGNLSFTLTLKCRAQCPLICSMCIWLAVYRFLLPSDIILTFYTTPFVQHIKKTHFLVRQVRHLISYVITM